LSAPRWPRAIAGIRRVLGEMREGTVAVGASARAQAYLSAAAPLQRRRPPVVQLMVEQQTLQRRVGRFAYRRVGSLVALGENVAESARALLPGVRVWKANNILDPNEIRVRERGARPGGAELGVATRLIPEKGILELLDELSGLEGWSRLRIAGAAPDPVFLAEVAARIESHGLGARVALEGFVEDIPGFLDSVDALLVPSTGREGQPNVIIEALAGGAAAIVRRPVFSADFEGLPVLPYDGASELGECLASLPQPPPAAAELRRRFGPDQAYEAILAAAEADA
jgi:glycosyltransferase involved in cell wall biosynthesis